MSGQQSRVSKGLVKLWRRQHWSRCTPSVRATISIASMERLRGSDTRYSANRLRERYLSVPVSRVESPADEHS